MEFLIPNEKTTGVGQVRGSLVKYYEYRTDDKQALVHTWRLGSSIRSVRQSPPPLLHISLKELLSGRRRGPHSILDTQTQRKSTSNPLKNHLINNADLFIPSPLLRNMTVDSVQVSSGMSVAHSFSNVCR